MSDRVTGLGGVFFRALMRSDGLVLGISAADAAGAPVDDETQDQEGM